MYASRGPGGLVTPCRPAAALLLPLLPLLPRLAENWASMFQLKIASFDSDKDGALTDTEVRLAIKALGLENVEGCTAFFKRTAEAGGGLDGNGNMTVGSFCSTYEQSAKRRSCCVVANLRTLGVLPEKYGVEVLKTLQGLDTTEFDTGVDLPPELTQSAEERFGHLDESERAEALYSACGRNDLESIQFLIGKGARIAQWHNPNQGELTPLHKASNQPSPVSFPTFLLHSPRESFPPSVAVCTRGPCTFLMSVSQWSCFTCFTCSKSHVVVSFQAATCGHVDIVKELLGAGAPPGALSSELVADTPLHKASLAGHDLVVTELINAGADVNQANGLKATPLHKAAHYEHVRVIKVLLHAGADKNLRNIFGETPLARAMQVGAQQSIALLS